MRPPLAAGTFSCSGWHQYRLPIFNELQGFGKETGPVTQVAAGAHVSACSLAISAHTCRRVHNCMDGLMSRGSSPAASPTLELRILPCPWWRPWSHRGCRSRSSDPPWSQRQQAWLAGSSAWAWSLFPKALSFADVLDQKHSWQSRQSAPSRQPPLRLTYRQAAAQEKGWPIDPFDMTRLALSGMRRYK